MSAEQVSLATAGIKKPWQALNCASVQADTLISTSLEADTIVCGALTLPGNAVADGSILINSVDNVLTAVPKSYLSGNSVVGFAVPVPPGGSYVPVPFPLATGTPTITQNIAQDVATVSIAGIYKLSVSLGFANPAPANNLFQYTFSVYGNPILPSTTVSVGPTSWGSGSYQLIVPLNAGATVSVVVAGASAGGVLTGSLCIESL